MAGRKPAGFDSSPIRVSYIRIRVSYIREPSPEITRVSTEAATEAGCYNSGPTSRAAPSTNWRPAPASTTPAADAAPRRSIQSATAPASGAP